LFSHIFLVYIIIILIIIIIFLTAIGLSTGGSGIDEVYIYITYKHNVLEKLAFM